jgi:ABC-type transport system involved in cytochrome c biogenesis permease subunit
VILIQNILLFVTFFLYVFSTIAYFISVLGRKWRVRDPKAHVQKWGNIGFMLAFIGFIAQVGFIVTRWIAGGHAPTSNMFEFTTFLAFSVIVAFLIIYRIYRITFLGLFVMPLTIILFAYAMVFPRGVTVLIPALQSYWLHIHVTTAALGEGAFAVGFAAGLMYLLHTVNQDRTSLETRLLEFIMWVANVLIAFIIMATISKATGFNEQFKIIDQWGKETVVEYTLPSIVAPHGGTKLTGSDFGPFFEAGGWMKGVNAGNKLNTIIWSIIGGSVLYGSLRLILRKRLSKAIQKWLTDIDEEVVDEISYRAIAIGFPIFTLGALVFAMIWAAEAWGRPWGWDPKEVWALITWLFYATYLHLRLSIGWHGKRSAWLSVLGFIIVMFTLIGVNLIIFGLHSYA